MLCKKCGIKEAEKKMRTCCSCNYLKKKQSNPIRLAYSSLKGHAKERGKTFTLTLEQFTEFCVKSDYINKKGTKKYSFHIDRKDETKGYEVGNIQLLTNTENVRKYVRFVEINRDGTKKFTTSIKVDCSNIPNFAPF